MPLQIFKSTDASAPSLSGEAGKLTSLLDACLVNGYATASVTGITRTSSTATATLAASNATLRTGDWITFSGAGEAEYNVTAQITVIDGTHVSYTVSGTPTTPATGTILYKKAAAGWATAFTGTNKRAYRSPNTGSNRFYVRVDDSNTIGTAGGAKEAAVRAYEAMTDIDTGTGDFPTVAQKTNGLCWGKSSTANTTARAWTLIADDKTFYLAVDMASGDAVPIFGFGHFNSYKAGDGFNTFLGGCSTFNSSANLACGMCAGYPLGSTTAGAGNLYLARSYTQTGGSITVNLEAGGVLSAIQLGSTSMSGPTYPNGPDSGLYISPVFVGEPSGGVIRGRLPGVFVATHPSIPFAQYDITTGVAGLSGVSLVAVNAKSVDIAGQQLYDITGPW